MLEKSMASTVALDSTTHAPEFDIEAQVLKKFSEVEDILAADGRHRQPSSHVVTARASAGEYLQKRQQLVANVAPIRSQQEVELFVELLRENLPARPTQCINWVSLARQFNRRILGRPPGAGMRLKTSTYLKDYAVQLMKRVQVQDAQQSQLQKVSLSTLDPLH